MSLLAPLDFGKPLGKQHVLLRDVSWEDYERCLETLDGDRTRVNYFEGEMEIMPPPVSHEHENRKTSIRRLIDQMTFVRGIEQRGAGSPTFRKKEARAGLEPDECYYFGENAVGAIEIKRFDGSRHPVPDLAIEVEVTSSAARRLAIYAALGVREIWRDNGARTKVLVLRGGEHVESKRSELFPFLPMPEFEAFVRRMETEAQLPVLRAFGDWVKAL